jgi:NAD+ synthase (glutamine-hydrolysing)
MTAHAKIAIVQSAVVPGNPRENRRRMLADIDTARTAGAELIVMHELRTSGYVLGDRWEHDEFIREIEATNEAIRRASVGRTIVWGSIRADWDRMNEDGRVRKYNAVMIASNGEWVSNGKLTGWIPKTNLPKYRIFDDARHFYPGDKLAAEMGCELKDILRRFPVTIGGKLRYLALTVCEDLWEDEYNTKPGEIYADQHPDLVIDISASPWTAEKYRARDRMLEKRAKEIGAPILYVNGVGLENNTKNLIWFDGGSTYIDKDGEFRIRAAQHKEEIVYFDFDLVHKLPPVKHELTGIAEIHAALIAGIRAFYGPTKKVIIGLSGGIDSAVMLALLGEALGAGRIIAINMPTKFNSSTTKNLAHLCAGNFGVDYREVPIQGIVNSIAGAVEEAGFGRPQGLSYENLQARTRSADILALVAQMFGGFFTCNGNKTEMALNYFTMYGDGAGAAAFLADLWKGQIYELARFVNKRAGRDLIPEGIINVIPSAELSADQNVDEGKGDPIFYPYHDFLLRAFTERRWDPTLVMQHRITNTLEHEIGCVPGIIDQFFKSDRKAFVENLEWCWKRYNMEFKRGQTPPVFIASRRAFGFDRRDPIADGYFTDRYATLKSAYLEMGSIH